MRDGFGVGLDVIAAEADVSKVTIYNHFGSKDQLFAEVIGSSLEDALTAAITGAYGTKLAPELSQKLVSSGVDMFLTYYRYQEAGKRR
jgi:TetR/AcrR family transcriptional regulator, mexJK operon transcriptional repressor